MSYYRICPYCHYYLDPGERCDCQQSKDKEQGSILSEKPKETKNEKIKKAAV